MLAWGAVFYLRMAISLGCVVSLISIGTAPVAARPMLVGTSAASMRPDRRPESKVKKPDVRRAKQRCRGRLVQLRSGPGFVVRDPRRAWGTRLAVRRLTQVMTAYHEQFPDAPPLMVHDLSLRRGGRLPPHQSHRGGRDVDIRLALNRPTTRYVKATPRSLHLQHTWALIELFFATGDVQEILLDRSLQRALLRHARGLGVATEDLRLILEYPGHRRRKPRPMVIHWSGHADHMHVRFRPETRPAPRHPAPRQLLSAVKHAVPPASKREAERPTPPPSVPVPTRLEALSLESLGL